MMLEVLIVFAILNATLPQQDFPVEVDLRLAGNEDEVASGSAGATAEPVQSTSIVDAATLTGLVGTAIALFTAYQKSKGERKELAERTDAVADSTVNVQQSLKATDVGNRDTAQILANALNKLSNVKSAEEIPQALAECAPAAKENAEEWNNDIKEYYENKPPTTSEDVGLDTTRQKLVQVNQQTKKTPES